MFRFPLLVVPIMKVVGDPVFAATDLKGIASQSAPRVCDLSSY